MDISTSNETTIPGIPSTETVWVDIHDKNGDRYIITSKATREHYYLYKVENGKAVKQGKAYSPIELEQKYIHI